MKEEQKSTLQIFLKKVTEEKNVKIQSNSKCENNLNIQRIELLKTKLSHVLSLKQNYLLHKTSKKSHSITQTRVALNKFVFNRFVSLGFELWRVNCSCSHFLHT